MSLFYPLLTLIAVPIERAWIMFVLGSDIMVHKSFTSVIIYTLYIRFCLQLILVMYRC